MSISAVRTLGGGGYAKPLPTFRFPLKRISTLPRDVGNGPREPLAVVPDGDSVVVVRKGLVTCHGSDLGVQHWHCPVEASGTLFVCDREVVTMAEESGSSFLTVIDRHSGELLRQLPVIQERTAINAVGPSGDVLLLRAIDSSIHLAIDGTTGRELWRCEGFGVHAVGLGTLFIVATADGTAVSGRNARSGEVEWTCALSQVSPGAQLRSGGQVLTAVDQGHVLVRLANDRLARISLSGEIVAVGAAGLRGEWVVTPDFYISGGSEGLSVVDHRTMEIVEQHEWENDVRTAFDGGLPQAYGLQVSSTSVLWISGAGLVAAVRRPGARGGRRKVWRDRIENAMFTVSHPVAAMGPFVYIAPIWTPRTSPAPPAVCCYSSAEHRDSMWHEEE